MLHNIKLIAATIIVGSSLIQSNIATASSVDFIDNGSYTTDTIGGLDWLDVTISVNQSYNYVSSQFGSGAEYEGWRYASGTEFNAMVSHWTDVSIASDDYSLVLHTGGAYRPLVYMLGSTLDTGWVERYGVTYEEYYGFPEDGATDYTFGMISDHYNALRIYSAAFVDNTPSRFQSEATSSAHASTRHVDDTNYHHGSFLVRDTLTTVPIPTAAWLMGTGLLGLVGLSRKKNLYQLRYKFT